MFLEYIYFIFLTWCILNMNKWCLGKLLLRIILTPESTVSVSVLYPYDHGKTLDCWAS